MAFFESTAFATSIFLDLYESPLGKEIIHLVFWVLVLGFGLGYLFEKHFNDEGGRKWGMIVGIAVSILITIAMSKYEIDIFTLSPYLLLIVSIIGAAIVYIISAGFFGGHLKLVPIVLALIVFTIPIIAGSAAAVAKGSDTAGIIFATGVILLIASLLALVFGLLLKWKFGGGGLGSVLGGGGATQDLSRLERKLDELKGSLDSGVKNVTQEIQGARADIAAIHAKIDQILEFCDQIINNITSLNKWLESTVLPRVNDVIGAVQSIGKWTEQHTKVIQDFIADFQMYATFMMDKVENTLIPNIEDVARKLDSNAAALTELKAGQQQVVAKLSEVDKLIKTAESIVGKIKDPATKADLDAFLDAIGGAFGEAQTQYDAGVAQILAAVETGLKQANTAELRQIVERLAANVKNLVAALKNAAGKGDYLLAARGGAPTVIINAGNDMRGAAQNVATLGSSAAAGINDAKGKLALARTTAIDGENALAMAGETSIHVLQALANIEKELTTLFEKGKVATGEEKEEKKKMKEVIDAVDAEYNTFKSSINSFGKLSDKMISLINKEVGPWQKSSDQQVLNEQEQMFSLILSQAQDSANYVAADEQMITNAFAKVSDVLKWIEATLPNAAGAVAERLNQLKQNFTNFLNQEVQLKDAVGKLKQFLQQLPAVATQGIQSTRNKNKVSALNAARMIKDMFNQQTAQPLGVLMQAAELLRVEKEALRTQRRRK